MHARRRSRAWNAIATSCTKQTSSLRRPKGADVQLPRWFDDVVKMELAKQALMQLGFKARAARRALEAALTRVGQDADIAALVQTVLAMNRDAAIDDDDASIAPQAKRALVQSGYSSAVAIKAVELALTHVGPDASLEVLIMEAFRRCAAH